MMYNRKDGETILEIFIAVVAFSVAAYCFYRYIKIRHSSHAQRCDIDSNTVQKSNEENNVPINAINFSVTTSFLAKQVEVKQKMNGCLSPTRVESIDGYVSPSGGYINYAVYQVIGKNPQTNRMNKKKYDAFSENEAITNALNDGLVQPFEVSVIPARIPTERQIAYANDLSIELPENVCFDDVSALISRVYNDDENPADELTMHILHQEKFKLSRFCGQKALLEMIDNSPSEQKKRIKSLIKEMNTK